MKYIYSDDLTLFFRVLTETETEVLYERYSKLNNGYDVDIHTHGPAYLELLAHRIGYKTINNLSDIRLTRLQVLRGGLDDLRILSRAIIKYGRELSSNDRIYL